MTQIQDAGTGDTSVTDRYREGLSSSSAEPGRAPAPRAPLSGYRRTFDVCYAVLAVTFLAGTLLQVFFAGLGTFQHSGVPGPGFAPHETLGNILSILAVVALVVALVARASWRLVVCAFVVALLTEVGQHALAQFGWRNQWLGAAHALDGMVILLLAAGLAFTSVRRNRGRVATT